MTQKGAKMNKMYGLTICLLTLGFPARNLEILNHLELSIEVGLNVPRDILETELESGHLGPLGLELLEYFELGARLPLVERCLLLVIS